MYMAQPIDANGAFSMQFKEVQQGIVEYCNHKLTTPGDIQKKLLDPLSKLFELHKSVPLPQAVEAPLRQFHQALLEEVDSAKVLELAAKVQALTVTSESVLTKLPPELLAHAFVRCTTIKEIL